MRKARCRAVHVRPFLLDKLADFLQTCVVCDTSLSLFDDTSQERNVAGHTLVVHIDYRAEGCCGGWRESSGLHSKKQNVNNNNSNN